MWCRKTLMYSFQVIHHCLLHGVGKEQKFNILTERPPSFQHLFHSSEKHVSFISLLLHCSVGFVSCSAVFNLWLWFGWMSSVSGTDTHLLFGWLILLFFHLIHESLLALSTFFPWPGSDFSIQIAMHVFQRNITWHICGLCKNLMIGLFSEISLVKSFKYCMKITLFKLMHPNQFGDWSNHNNITDGLERWSQVVFSWQVLIQLSSSVVWLLYVQTWSGPWSSGPQGSSTCVSNWFASCLSCPHSCVFSNAFQARAWKTCMTVTSVELYAFSLVLVTMIHFHGGTRGQNKK